MVLEGMADINHQQKEELNESGWLKFDCLKYVSKELQYDENFYMEANKKKSQKVLILQWIVNGKEGYTYSENDLDEWDKRNWIFA